MVARNYFHSRYWSVRPTKLVVGLAINRRQCNSAFCNARSSDSGGHTESCNEARAHCRNEMRINIPDDLLLYIGWS